MCDIIRLAAFRSRNVGQFFSHPRFGCSPPSFVCHCPRSFWGQNESRFARRTMRILIASNFKPERHSGAAGSLLEIGEAHQRQGREVDWLWMPKSRRTRLIEEPFLTPWQQARQIGEYLNHKASTDVVVVSQPFAFRAFERLTKKHPRTLFVNRTHGWEPRYSASQDQFGWDSPTRVGGRLFRWVARRLREHMCRRTVLAAHGVIAVCSQDAAWIRSTYNLTPQRVACIPYGIMNDRFPQAPTRIAGRLPQRLIFAGQYRERKGSRVLEEVLPRLAADFPETKLTFIVPQSEVALVKAVFEHAWGDRLLVQPWLPKEALYQKLAKQDILLFPSHFEGFGKIVVEAMAMGCVPVGFTEGALLDLKDCGALTCPVGDRAAFNQLLRELLQGRVDFADVSRRASEQARRRSWDDVAEDEGEFFRRLASENGLDLGSFTDHAVSSHAR
ncbi:MAG: hypothetical protein C0483_17635 [Pirellula sp.]|nr:hypothetical protein [Pirellula sp.]